MENLRYNAGKAVDYAHRWAYKRNPQYYNFDAIGGDCTNFVSQCLYAGSQVMNYKPDFGWYYISAANRAAAWTGVEYLHNFLINNDGAGPFGSLVDISQIKPGDIIQLKFDADNYGHSLLVVSAGKMTRLRDIKVATHTMDADNRPLSSYTFSEMRCIHIEGVNA